MHKDSWDICNGNVPGFLRRSGTVYPLLQLGQGLASHSLITSKH